MIKGQRMPPLNVNTAVRGILIGSFGSKFANSPLNVGIDVGVISGATNNYAIRTGTQGTVSLRDSTIIGGTSLQQPTERLEVVGNVYASGAFMTPSDARFKQDINTLEGSLDKVLQLRGVNYVHTEKAIKERSLEEGTQVGFIAQELEAIYPEFVRTGKDGFKVGRLRPPDACTRRSTQKRSKH